MRKNRRIAALLTAGLLALTPCVSAGMMFASAADDNSISITPAIAGSHNYAAYQIFKGTLSGTGAVDNPATTDVDESDPYVLSDIKWGDNAADDFLTKLKADTAFNLVAPAEEGGAKTSIFVDAENAEDVANVLEQYNDNSDVAIAFAKFAGNHLKGDAKGSDNSSPYQIGSLAAGYYLVEDTAPITDGENANPRTLNLLRVAGAVSMKTKEDLPTIDKKIDEKGGIAANTASVGDVVPYIITSHVPDMTGYTKYFFELNDTLSKGLDYNSDSLSITIGNKTLVEGTDYTIDTEKDNSTNVTSIDIVFKNFIQYDDDNLDIFFNEDDAGTYYKVDGKYTTTAPDPLSSSEKKYTKDTGIVVKYTATVNENADMTQTGNINTAQLTYSNNPNQDATGDPGNPDKPKPPVPDDPSTPDVDESEPGDPTGQTPEIKTVTYVTQIDLTKTKADGTTPLANATFTLEGYLKTVGVASGKYYVEDASGTFYRLADGTYTETDPTTNSKTAYESTNKKYKQVEASAIPEASKISKEVTTGTDGKINFAGLGEGTYTITEKAAPSGFNLLKKPITVTITASGVSITGCEWGYDLDDENNATIEADFEQGDKDGNASYLPLTVKNTEGSTLPSTGGVGTKLFYLFGGMLAVGSGVVLVTKKRMSYEK